MKRIFFLAVFAISALTAGISWKHGDMPAAVVWAFNAGVFVTMATEIRKP